MHLLPVQLAFGIPQHPAHIAIDFVVDAAFWVDVVLNFRTTFVTEDESAHAKAVAKRYAKSWLTPIRGDAERHLPGLAGESVGSSRCSLVRLLRLEGLEDLERLKAATCLRILRLVLGFFLLAHWVACAWWALGIARFNLDDDTGVPWILGAGLPAAFTFDATRRPRTNSLSYYLGSEMPMPAVGASDTVAEKALGKPSRCSARSASPSSSATCRRC